MWIDYEKSKKAVERTLYTCRDYILKGYFDIDDRLNVHEHFSERFSSGSGAFINIMSDSKGSQNLLLENLQLQEDQIEWISKVIKAIKSLKIQYQKIIIYHYLKGYNLTSLKSGIIENGKIVKINKPNQKNSEALQKLMLLLNNCLIAYTKEVDMNKLIIKFKSGTANFVTEKKKN